VKLSPLGDNDYNNKLNTFIATSFECNNTLKLNNFGTKYINFTQVAAKIKGILESKNSNNKESKK